MATAADVEEHDVITIPSGKVSGKNIAPLRDATVKISRIKYNVVEMRLVDTNGHERQYVLPCDYAVEIKRERL